MKKICITILIGLLLVGVWNPLTSVVKATTNDWWDPAWEYRKEIMINHNMVDADLANFPILFHNTSSDFIEHAQNNGDDFAFISTDGTTQYNHEIEYYNSTTGELIAWVNITGLSSTFDTTLYLYYGNSSCSSQENVVETWDSNYLGVWHMNGSTDMMDSTSNNHIGLEENTPTEETGKIGTCQNLTHDDGDSFKINHVDSLNITTNNITVSGWGRTFNRNTTTEGSATYQYMFAKTGVVLFRLSKDTPAEQNDFEFFVHDGVTYEPRVDDDTVPTNFSWYYWVGTFGSNVMKIYRNGTLIDSVVDVKTMNNSNTQLFLGRWSTRNSWNGTLDELRYSDIARNASWINTCYNTMNRPSTFLSVGSEQWYLDDHIPPTVQITQPEFGFLYINLLDMQYKIPIFIPFATLIIGKITVAVDTEDNMGIEYVEFYIDDVLKATITEPPYNWTWDKQNIIFPHTLKVCARDFSENEKWAEINVWKMQLFQ